LTHSPPLDAKARTRRLLVAGAGAWVLAGQRAAQCLAGADAPANPRLNSPQVWPIDATSPQITLRIDADHLGHRIERRIFGTNLEWFNDAGGLAEPQLLSRLVERARDLGTTVLRFPGGTLADYYDWRDGTGVRDARPTRHHPTDSGSSKNRFGSPELFDLMQATGAEALLTVNAGTGSAREAADWVAYCNSAASPAREADGFAKPLGIKLWEIGNELYLPGNPGEVKITVTPDVYAERYLAFVAAMRAVDPSITTIGIGVAMGSHIGPDTQFPEWSEVLLKKAAPRLDMIAVHNSYFPELYNVITPPVETVYPALWAAPDAVEASLNRLADLMAHHEGARREPMGIAVTEWGALFSVPQRDPYWTDHVKTLGSAVYTARTLQVLLAHPRVKLANHFKFTDRSFMGMVNYEGNPKVPFHAFQLLARHTGSHLVAAQFDTMPGYDTDGIGNIAARRDVPDVTVLATRDGATGRLYVNLVNRSLRRSHRIKLDLQGIAPKPGGTLLTLRGPQPTAHNGRDLPAEWPYSPAYEPYSTAANGIDLEQAAWRTDEPLVLAPFSVATFTVEDARFAG
jgi:alpha-N-arabinofuranosidase